MRRGITALLTAAAIGGFGISPAAAQSRCAPIAPLAPALPAAKFDDGPMIAQSVILADFDAWMSGMRRLNPDLSIRADMKALNREAALIRKELTKPMSRREVWLHFAKLNPYFHDAHAGIQMPDYRGALEAHIKAGGHVVPLDIRFAKDGSLRVFTVAAGADAIKHGDRLLSINGHGADQMVAAMMPLTIGDTLRSRHAFLERRLAMLFWYLYGDTGQYDVVVQTADACPLQIRVMGGTTLQEELQSQPSAQEMFDWRILPGNIGYLRVDAFDSGRRMRSTS